jgi:hypothetical protein
MTQLQVVYPLRSGTQERWRRLCQELGGAYREEFAASCQRMGITSGEVRLLHVFNSDVLLVTVFISNPAHAVNVLARSDEPADRWLRAQLQSVLGWTLQDIPADPSGELILAWGP